MAQRQRGGGAMEARRRCDEDATIVWQTQWKRKRKGGGQKEVEKEKEEEEKCDEVRRGGEELLNEEKLEI